MFSEVYPAGPFELAESARFFRGWAPEPTGKALELPMALIRDDLRGVAGVVARPLPGGAALEIAGEEPQRVAAQAARVLSLDVDATEYPAVGVRDPVAGALMAGAPGLRPVLFHTPYEAGAWAILSQRVPGARARAMRAELGEALGREVRVAGRRMRAFPLPDDLLAAPGLPGIPAVKADRLRALAAAALEGRLDAARLRGLDPDLARAELRALPGIGPFSADLILLRGAGTTDVASPSEPRLRRAVGGAYGIDARDDAAFAAVTEGWRPWRTWVSVLFRALAG